MTKKYKERSLVEFQKKFQDNEACAKLLVEKRWPNGFVYKVILRDPKAAGKLLPWVHRVISNEKVVIRGSHRGVYEKHLQAYLSEICYRFNRRSWEKELFDSLVKACVYTRTITHGNLVRGQQSIHSY